MSEDSRIELMHMLHVYPCAVLECGKVEKPANFLSYLLLFVCRSQYLCFKCWLGIHHVAKVNLHKVKITGSFTQ